MDLFFSSNLKYLRQIHNMSQEELADLVQYSFKNVSKWETGQSIPTYEILIKLTKIFNVDMIGLMERNLSRGNTISKFKTSHMDEKTYLELTRCVYKYLYDDTGCEKNKKIFYDLEKMRDFLDIDLLYKLKKENLSFSRLAYLIEKILYQLKCNGMIDYYECEQDLINQEILVKYKCI